MEEGGGGRSEEALLFLDLLLESDCVWTAMVIRHDQKSIVILAERFIFL